MAIASRPIAGSDVAPNLEAMTSPIVETATAADAAANGFRTRVLLGLTAGVSPGTTAEAITELSDTGVEVSPA